MNRRDFIPDTIWIDGDDGWMVPLRRSEYPQEWLDRCDRDDAVVIQVDDGDVSNDRGVFPTSSSSAPTVMRMMIEALDPQHGMKVMEIGSATGYNAALLADTVGAENVTTIEIDPALADHARDALQRAGLPVTVVTGNGATGYARNAPYDRVIATAAVQQVPHAWIAQCRPGARVVAPWAGAFIPVGAMLTLTVGDDGIADGRFGDGLGFMYLRQQRPTTVPWVSDDEAGDYVETIIGSYPHEPFTDEFAATFAMGVRLPGCMRGETIDEGVHTFRLFHHESGSWASLTPGARAHVLRQHGPRHLWDELEAAYEWWTKNGRPGSTRFGMTVTREGQRIWLDSPDEVVSP